MLQKISGMMLQKISGMMLQKISGMMLQKKRQSNYFRSLTQECYIFHSLTEHPVLLSKTAFPVPNQR